jgi:hypothetical protein
MRFTGAGTSPKVCVTGAATRVGDAAAQEEPVHVFQPVRGPGIGDRVDLPAGHLDLGGQRQRGGYDVFLPQVRGHAAIVSTSLAGVDPGEELVVKVQPQFDARPVPPSPGRRRQPTGRGSISACDSARLCGWD